MPPSPAGALGTVTGLVLSRRYEIDPGDGTSASLGSLWGTWYGVGLGVVAGLEDDALLASTLIGGNLGLVVGAVLGSKHDVSRSRARIASIAGVAGGLAGAGVDLLLQPDDEEVAMAIPLVTSTIGLALGLGADRRRGREEVRAVSPEAWTGGSGAPCARPWSTEGRGSAHRRWPSRS